MHKNHPVYLIVAADKSNGIGKDGDLPWKLKGDMQFFKDITTKTKDPNKQNMLIMGRTTWESIPKAHRPLEGRQNLILSRKPNHSAEGASTFATLHEALDAADENTETIFIIGGGNVFYQIINNPELTGLYVTRINHDFHCDTFFPSVPEKFSKVTSLGKEKEGNISYEYLLYEMP